MDEELFKELCTSIEQVKGLLKEHRRSFLLERFGYPGTNQNELTEKSRELRELLKKLDAQNG